ncbi:MAG TPA: hypothetical protein VMV59_12010 [Candidatus Dormibacteraeota bacterium]|nr:hypothetical protein [Candidatus Dormibacteraeota bacterium]
MPTAEAVQKEWEFEPLEAQEWPDATPQVAGWDEAATEITVKLSVSVGVHAPSRSEKLKAEFERAREILKLKDDWDGEGSVGYSTETLDRAILFVSTHASKLWESFGLAAPIPTIGPGPDGSIDVHWKLPAWELLVNIPQNSDAMATFYGDDYGAQKIRGSFDPRRFNSGVAEWLIR